MGRIRELAEWWRLLDTEALMHDGDSVDETTTTANVGAYPVPLGGMLRRVGPSVPKKKTKKKLTWKLPS